MGEPWRTAMSNEEMLWIGEFRWNKKLARLAVYAELTTKGHREQLKDNKRAECVIGLNFMCWVNSNAA